MSITLKDIELLLKQNSGVTDSQILKSLIQDDIASEAKKEMANGVKYYDVKNTHILDDVDFRKYYNDNYIEFDYQASNNKITNAFHTILTNQKNSYITGNPITFTTEDIYKNPLEQIIELFGDDFDDLISNWELKSTNKGVEWLHVYIDRNGEFKLVIIPAEQVIPIYDTDFETNIEQIIRYYEVEYINEKSEVDTKYKVEWWTANNVTYYIQTDAENYILDPDIEINPAGHFMLSNNRLNINQAGSWGRVPFIALPNNNRWRSDLYLIKSLIDDFDFNTSDFSNILRDFQENIYKISGYSGSNISELRRRLKTYRIVLTDVGGDVTTIQNPIEKDARDSHLDRLEENIYIFGMGVNPKIMASAGNVTNVYIQSLFSLLDFKARLKMRKIEKALKQLIYFACYFLDIEQIGKYVNVVFNKSTIMNEMEQVQKVTMSKGIVSDMTLLANHPFVNDVEAELKLLDEQQVDLFGNEEDGDAERNSRTDQE